jgi:hypothetical protein
MKRKFTGGYNPNASMTLWHGTTSGAGKSIVKTGLQAKRYGTTMGKATLSNRRPVAAMYRGTARKFGNRGAVIKVQLPIAKVDRYVHRSSTMGLQGLGGGKTRNYATFSLKKPVPAKYVSLDTRRAMRQVRNGRSTRRSR